MSEYAQNDHNTQLSYDQSVYNQSSKANSMYGEQMINQRDSDSQDDIQIKMYHQMILDNYSQDVKSQPSSCFSSINAKEDFDQEFEKKSMNSIKSMYSSKSNRSFKTDKNRSLKTLRTMNSGGTLPYSRDKKKYMREQQRRILRELRDEQQKQKKQKKQYKNMDIDFDFEAGKKKGRRGKNLKKRKQITKRTLQLLAKKFDQYYAGQNNMDYKGPKISINQIGNLFDMGHSTIHKLYKQWMEDPSFYQRMNRENMKQKTPQRKVTLQRIQHVARLIKQNPFLTQNELTVELNKIEDLKYVKNGERVEITRTTVSRLLKVGKFKKKRVKCVPKQRNTTKSLQKRYDYCVKYKEIWQKRAKVYFLDQSGFNLYMTRDKAWARPNEQITVNCPIAKGKRFSLIAIIAEDGLIHWRIIQGTYRKYQYLDFIKSLFLRLKQEMDQLTEEQRNQQENMRQKWLILDNCAIHDKEQTVNMAKECNMQILYLPPYSPQLNPIQNWFNEVKSKVRKINYSGEKQLLDIMHRTLKQYENFDFMRYFQGALKHVDKGIKKEKF